MAIKLKEDYKDYISIGDKQYKLVSLANGYYNIIDVTAYDIIGDDIEASDINTITKAINDLSKQIDSTQAYAETINKKLENSGKVRVAAKVTLVGDGTTNTWKLNHDLGSKDIAVHVYDVTTGEEWIIDNVRDTVDTVIIGFQEPPAKNQQFRVLIYLISSTDLTEEAVLYKLATELPLDQINDIK